MHTEIVNSCIRKMKKPKLKEFIYHYQIELKKLDSFYNFLESNTNELFVNYNMSLYYYYNFIYLFFTKVRKKQNFVLNKNFI